MFCEASKSSLEEARCPAGLKPSDKGCAVFLFEFSTFAKAGGRSMTCDTTRGDDAIDREEERFGIVLSMGLRVVQLELALEAKLEDLRAVRRSAGGGILGGGGKDTSGLEVLTSKSSTVMVSSSLTSDIMEWCSLANPFAVFCDDLNGNSGSFGAVLM